MTASPLETAAPYDAVLVAVDGSPAANRAVEQAGRLAAREGRSLLVLHVIEGQRCPSPMRQLRAVERLADSRREVLELIAQRVVAEAVDRARRVCASAAPPMATTRIAWGDPATQILATAVDGGAGVIAVGCKRRRHGRIGRRLVRQAQQDLWFIRAA